MESAVCFFFQPHCTACGILVPQPYPLHWIKTISSALEAQSLNHWTAKAVPETQFLSEAFIANLYPTEIINPPHFLFCFPNRAQIGRQYTVLLWEGSSGLQRSQLIKRKAVLSW